MLRAVKLSVKTDYAARAVLELAGHPADGPARKVEELATVVGTSANFLVQILIDLKSAGIVASVRGKQGGYRLAKGPADISLGSVWRAVDGAVMDLQMGCSVMRSLRVMRLECSDGAVMVQ